MRTDGALAAQLEELGRFVARLESPFVWTGTWTPRPEARLRFADGTSVPFAPFSKGTREEALAALVRRAEPAPFGQGKLTKRDQRVRDGLRILAKPAGLELEDVDLRAEGVLDAIAAELAPESRGSLGAELYSVNLYGRGGHFVRHKDTPRSADMLGTLVVCLPFAFQGGALHLERDDRKIGLDWSPSSVWQTGDLACAAFYGDVDHAIAEVTGGTRVTLTFLLHRTSPRKKAEPKKTANDATEMTRLLADIANESHVMQHGATLQIPCLHEYAATTKTPVVERLAGDGDTLARLKGRDATVACAALAAGIETSLAYCLCIDQMGLCIGEPLKRAPSEKYLERLRKLVTRASGSEEQELGRPHAADEISETDDGAPERRIVGPFPRSATFLGVGLYSATDFYGNEASDAFFYVAAVLELAFPRRSAAAPDKLDVIHAKWGRGRVLSATIENGERKVRIRFVSGEEKTLLERFVTFA
jgi:hypothetical protein